MVWLGGSDDSPCRWSGRSPRTKRSSPVTPGITSVRLLCWVTGPADRDRQSEKQGCAAPGADSSPAASGFTGRGWGCPCRCRFAGPISAGARVRSSWELPPGADEVARITVRVVLQVILVLRLSFPEG